MKRTILAALVLMLVVSVGVNAQSVPAVVMDVAVPADSIGDGWAITHEEESAGYPMPWDRQISYGGPEGARVTVWLLGLGYGLEWVSGSWGRMTAFWSDIATRETGIGDPVNASLFTEHVGVDIDAVVTDTKGVSGTRTAGAVPIAVCQYGAYDVQIGVIVLVEGSVNELTGVAAADYIAGLYFAALSDQ